MDDDRLADVIQLLAVEVEEVYQQLAYILGLLLLMLGELCGFDRYLEQGDDHERDGIAAQAALVGVAQPVYVHQHLDDQHQGSQQGLGSHEGLDHVGALEPHVPAALECDVDADAIVLGIGL